MKLAQNVYLFFNNARLGVSCTNCDCDLTFNPDVDQRPPLMLTRKTKPYCIDCAYLLKLSAYIGECHNKTSSAGNGGH